MTKDEVMKELEAFGSESTKKIFIKHGAKEPFFGVKVQDLKKIVKKIKKDHELSLELYDTSNYDAMYLAGLIADESKITKKDLNNWVKKAYWHMISEYIVAWVAADSPHGYDLGLKWIESKTETTATAGWATLASLTSVKADEDLNIKKLDELLDRVGETIHDAPNRVRYVMNGFVIAVGGNVAELTEKASKIAEKIGKVSVSMGKTACKVPLATTYIQKMVDKGSIGKKRKSARC
ncbi:MAG: DNA alkylation repair protein [Aureispira sp.]|nr:DNA alkylation repair protein [Aureispira sp.]